MVDLDSIHTMLARAAAPDLARIIGHSAHYSVVIRKVALLHVAFLESADHASLIEAVRDAATVDDHVPYTEADAYCQVLYELALLVQRLADSGSVELARQILTVAISAGESSAELIMDGVYWQMSVNDLRKLAERLDVQDI